jgi:hypothetical protein
MTIVLSVLQLSISPISYDHCTVRPTIVYNRRTDSTMVKRNRTKKTIIGQTVQWSYEIELKDNRRTDSAMVIRNRINRQLKDRQYNGHPDCLKSYFL